MPYRMPAKFYKTLSFWQYILVRDHKVQNNILEILDINSTYSIL